MRTRLNPRTLATHTMARWGYSFASENLHTFDPDADPEGFEMARRRWAQARAVLRAVDDRMEADRIDAANRRATPFPERVAIPKDSLQSCFPGIKHGSRSPDLLTRFAHERGHDREERHAS